MAACCAVGALVIYKLMSIYSCLPQLSSAKLEKDEPLRDNEGQLITNDKDDAGPQTSRFSLHGLTCISCVAAVEKSLRAAPGVQEVSVSLHALTALVTFDPEKMGPSELQAVIEDAGFGAELSSVEDDWKSQWTSAARSRQKSTAEWQCAFNRSIIAGLTVFVIENLGPWIAGNELMPALEAVAHAITTLSILLLAGSIHQEAFAALRHGRLTTSTLSSAGLLCVLASASLRELIGPCDDGKEVPLTSASMLLALTIGVKLIKCAVSKKSSELPTLLASSLPETVSLLTDLTSESLTTPVPLRLLQVGDNVQVERGAAFPADCMIIEGISSVLQTIITGELDPVAVKVGDSVHAGSTNCVEQVRARVLRLGKDTWLGHTLSAVSRTAEKKSELQVSSDGFLDWFGSVVILLAMASVIVQAMEGESLGVIITRTASILLCACPCTMGMGIPVCLMATARNSYDAGILLSAGLQIENAASSRVIVFDKTGTLTSGNLRLQSFRMCSGWDRHETRLWQMIYALSKQSHHPVSRLLMRSSRSILQNDINRSEVTLSLYEEVSGLGQRGQLLAMERAYDIAIGNHRFMQMQGTYLDSSASVLNGVVFVSVNGKLAMSATYEDDVVPGASKLIHDLSERGFDTHLMTGDTKTSALKVAGAIGMPLDNVHASLLPQDKSALIESLERRYGAVIMVGDNLNDAPALAAATFGIVAARNDAYNIQTKDCEATKVLQKLYEEADALLMPEVSTMSCPYGLLRVAYIVDLIHETSRRMHRILQWSIMYNTVALLVVCGFVGRCVPGTTWAEELLDPTLSSLLMSINSVVTLTYCLRIEKWRPTKVKLNME